MLKVSINGREFQQALEGVAREQFPFAMALALTRSAEEAVKEEVADLPNRFIVRRQWIAKGFRVDRATKQNLTAVIRHKDPFMALQEEGGEKEPNKTKSVAIPQAARPTPQSTTPQSKWPGRINRRFFITKGDTVYEFARSGRRTRKRHKRKGELVRNLAMKKRGLDPNLKLMYVMKKSVKVKPRLELVATVRRVAAQRVPVNFDGFLRHAIKTAR